MVSGIEAEAGQIHRVGTALPLEEVDIEDSHYRVRKPEAGGPIRFVERWVCPKCRAVNWVEIDVEGVVRSIEIRPFDRSLLERVHFVTDLVEEHYRNLVGESFYVDDAVRVDWVARIKPFLDAGDTPAGEP